MNPLMKKDPAVSEAVSFIFVLAAVLVLVSLFLVYGLPAIEDKKETDELDAVLHQFSAIQSDMDELVLTKACGIQRDILLPVKKGEVVLTLTSKDPQSPFTLSYESPSGDTLTLETEGLFKDGRKVQSFASPPAADAALSREGASVGKPAVVSFTLINTRETGGSGGLFSVRLV